jgi:hypothetical protein
MKNQVLPSKLLIELASLPSEHFKVEMKSKCQSITFPLSTDNLNNLKVKSIGNSSDLNLGKEKKSDQEINQTNSPLENDYIILKCFIVNKDLPLVPPIRIYTTHSYPQVNPFVDCIQLDESDDDMLPDYGLNFT